MCYPDKDLYFIRQQCETPFEMSFLPSLQVARTKTEIMRAIRDGINLPQQSDENKMYTISKLRHEPLSKVQTMPEVRRQILKMRESLDKLQKGKDFISHQ